MKFINKKILIIIFYTITICDGFKMLPINKIPIITAYKNIDKNIEIALDNPIMRSKLSLISSHGLTDLISFNPEFVLPRYFNAACLCFYTNTDTMLTNSCMAYRLLFILQHVQHFYNLMNNILVFLPTTATPLYFLVLNFLIFNFFYIVSNNNNSCLLL